MKINIIFTRIDITFWGYLFFCIRSILNDRKKFRVFLCRKEKPFLEMNLNAFQSIGLCEAEIMIPPLAFERLTTAFVVGVGTSPRVKTEFPEANNAEVRSDSK